MMDDAHDSLDLPKEDFKKPDPGSIEGVSTQVPDVRGMTVDDATKKLADEGFDASVSGEVNSDLDKGLVVRTSPESGAKVGSGTSIGLYVSNGIPPGNDDDDDDGDDGGDNGWEINPPTVPPTPPTEGNGEGNDDDDDDGSGWR